MLIEYIKNFYAKISWKMLIAFLGVAGLLFFLTAPFQKEMSAWDFYNQMVKVHEMIKGVELSELKDKFKVVANKRNDCYGEHAKISSRLRTCRKRYLYDILELARENIKSAPDLGKFLLCIENCPFAYSMCRGEKSDESDSGSECIVREVQCIEFCLDTYWRGVE